MQDWVSSFKSQFGDAVTTDTAAHAIQGVSPACVCAPENEAQAAAVIRFAAAYKIPVVPCGGGTSQGRCAPPPAGFLALSTKRMNKLIHHEPGDMVATVQGGMTMEEFEKAIGEGGQWLPIDAPSNATIGGITAANTHGPRAHGYGTLRDMILGMTVINGDGVIRKCGGKVVKNVTGYALDKLYIGSFGTLGLITEVTFKLRPIVIESSFGSATVNTLAEGLAAMHAIAARNLPLEFLQLIVCPPLKWIGLLVRAAGTPLELLRIGAEIELASKLKFETDFDSKQLAAASAAMDGETNHPSIPSAQLRMGCSLSKLSAALAALVEFESATHFIGLDGALVDLAPVTEAQAARISADLEKLGVNFAWENIVGVNIPNRWGAPRPEWAIMKQIKAALDPQGIMNPGRFVV